jgi:hypothetical protein
MYTLRHRSIRQHQTRLFCCFHLARRLTGTYVAPVLRTGPFEACPELLATQASLRVSFCSEPQLSLSLAQVNGIRLCSHFQQVRRRPLRLGRLQLAPPPSLMPTGPIELCIAHTFADPRAGPATKRAFQQMQQQVEFIANSRTLVEAVTFITSNTRQRFKDRSHEGAVFRQGRSRDEGNWPYSLLFQMLLKTAAEDHCLHTLGSTYQTLAANAPSSMDALSLQGDVIEVLLAFCREQGPAVERTLQTDRRLVHQAVKVFADKLQDIRCMVTDDPRSSYNSWPWPSEFLAQVG